MKSIRLTLLFFLAFVSASSMAQIEMPPPSPTFELSGTVGLANVKVVYSRPSTKGRKIYGDLVPFGEVWRTGANASTKLTFSQDVMLEGNLLPAGKYALYTIPGTEEWTIIISKNIELWGAVGYSESEDLMRFNVPTKSVSSHYETFTISFSDFTDNSAYLNFKWEKTKAKIKIVNEVDDKVMSQIQDQVIDNHPDNSGVYYQAASYYFTNNKDDKMALNFINNAIDGGQEKYWAYHLKAKILARLGMDEEAEVVAKKSIEKAKEAGNPDYVRLNEKLIAGLK